MRNVGTWLRVVWLLPLLSFGSISNVQSQDIFRDMDQMKRDVADLKNQVSELQTQFYWLRRAVLKSVPAQEQKPSEKAAPAEKKPAKEETAVDDKELTRKICQAVGKFFTEADAALRMGNSDAAKEKMRRAFRTLNSKLEGYQGLHRVNKLLGIYEGLTWDTYVAVELAQSVQGNEDFIAALNRHKQKYADTCPKE